MFRKLTITLGLITTFVFAGCGGPETRAEKLETAESNGWDDEPEWAQAPPAGCGVGIAKHHGDKGMTRDTAMTRARTELGRWVDTTVQSMIEDYQASGETGGEGFSEEMTTNVKRNLTEVSIPGSLQKASYITKEDPPNYYSLVCIDPEGFTRVFGETEGLDDAQREALKKRAEAKLADMDKALETIRRKK